MRSRGPPEKILEASCGVALAGVPHAILHPTPGPGSGSGAGVASNVGSGVAGDEVADWMVVSEALSDLPHVGNFRSVLVPL